PSQTVTYALYSLSLHDALPISYGLDLWQDKAPPIRGSRLSGRSNDGSVSYDWTGYYKKPALSVDERVKMSVWLDLVEQMGGRVRSEEHTSELQSRENLVCRRLP